MNSFVYALLAVSVVSLVSLIGVVTLSMKEANIRKFSVFFVSFAVGALFGDVFIHLIPELYKIGAEEFTPFFILGGILFFLILEKFLHWRHCHVTDTHDHIHPMVASNLIGDAFHNFLDGLLIASSFAVSPTVGLATTIAVFLHEIPQELGDFGVMIHSGMKVKKALILNLLSALVSILGVFAFLVLGNFVTGIEKFILPLTIGGFIYIAGSDLVPELKHEENFKTSIAHLIPLILGILIMYSFTLFE